MSFPSQIPSRPSASNGAAAGSTHLLAAPSEDSLTDDARVLVIQSERILPQRTANPTILKMGLSCVDHTSLNDTDTSDGINELVGRVNRLRELLPDFHPIAGFCTWPRFAPEAAKRLKAEIIPVSVAAGFPGYEGTIEERCAEVRSLVAAGAREIDVVFPRDLFFTNRDQAAADLRALKTACGEARLKVILETAELPNLVAVWDASILSLTCGADFIKTSTGKSQKGGATPERFAVMCMAAHAFTQATGNIVGLKPAGGMKEPIDGIRFLTIAQLGYFSKIQNPAGEVYTAWLAQFFRLGTSGLTPKFIEALKLVDASVPDAAMTLFKGGPY